MKWNLVCNDCTTSVLFIFYSCCCCYCCFCCSIQLYWSISQIYGIQNKSKYLLLLLLQCWTILFIEWINSSRNLNSLSFGRGCMFFFSSLLKWVFSSVLLCVAFILFFHFIVVILFCRSIYSIYIHSYYTISAGMRNTFYFFCLQTLTLAVCVHCTHNEIIYYYP